MARASAEAGHKLGITFDMDDPKVARDVMKATFEGQFPTAGRPGAGEVAPHKNFFVW